MAVFVELPPGTDLAVSPFAYVTQHRLARRVATVSLEELEGLAAQVAVPQKVVLVFSIGRCGSTLLSHALNAVPDVWCLSEPDAFSTLILQHYHSRARVPFPPDQIIRLIRACTRLQFRPPANRTSSVFAMKFRSQALFQADLYHQALPEAACIFLYRDALGWADSVYGMLRQYGYPDMLPDDERAATWNVFTAASEQARLDACVDRAVAGMPMELALAPAWSENMEEYTRHLRGGVPFLALRYNEFNRDREQSVARILEHCGVPVRHAATALAAFEADSQRGTHLAQDVTTERLTVERLERLRVILSQCGEFSDPDLRLADIYSGSGS